MWTQILRKRRLSLLIGGAVGAFLAFAFFFLQNDIHRNHLDPKIPFQVYKPPAAPDYTKVDSWYLDPALANFYADPRKVDVFFVHATSFDGGKAWLGGIDSNAAVSEVERVQLPNYAAPFAIMGNIYAPKYRQASLYTQLTLREDSVEARAFAYGDVQRAFAEFLRTRRGGKGFVIVGIEQGGLLAERLVHDVVAADPKLKAQLVAAYFLETFVPTGAVEGPSAPFPACESRQQTGCIFSYVSVDGGRPDKALQVLQKSVYWQGGNLEPVSSQKALCINPLTGTPTPDAIDARHALGATNATGLEWGIEPAVIARKVAAHCLSGLLFVDKPKSPSFEDSGSWEDQRKVNPYNLFYSDLQADMRARWLTFSGS